MQKKIIVIIIVLLILLILETLFLITSRNHSNKNFYTTKEIKLNVCKDGVNCYAPELEYRDFNYKTSNKTIQTMFDKMNAKIEEDYKQTLDSDINTEECQNVKDKFKYSYGVYILYNEFENDDFINITIQRNETNFCQNIGNYRQAQSAIYDKKHQHLLTQEEFKKQLGITEQNIYKSIKSTIEFKNKDENKNYKLAKSYDDIVLFYMTNGNLIASFYQPDANTYLTALIEQKN